jgi:transketolase
MTTTRLDERSKDLRRVIVRTLQKARRGHVGAAFSLIEIFRVLYDDVLRFNPQDPKWKGRDRCILSKGHGCLALYALLADKGYFPPAELDKFCAPDGILGGHPDAGKVPGVEASTGALGHGLPIGVGIALSQRIVKSDSRVFVVLGDGECNEGSVWEAAMCAGKHGLSNLTAIVDYNKHQSYASTKEVQDLEPFADKWRSFGFAVREVDGHDVPALRATLGALPFVADKPCAVIAHTVKGKGAHFAENNMKWHHKNKVTDQEVEALLAAIGEA